MSMPESIGGYSIVELIGQGSMGQVYRARQSHPEREVALKLVSGLGREAGVRLRREVEVLARLEHPGIARLYAAGEDTIGGLAVPWLALEYVRGVDLGDWTATAHPDRAARVRVLIGLCRAVHYAHVRGVVHRDLKPANILIEAAGQPRVLDFGIARVLDGGAGDATLEGQVLGSLPYMSPEQLAGDNGQVDARSDVYALGAIAYELLSGQLPYPRLAEATLFEAVELHRNWTPPRLRQVDASLPADLDAVVMKAMASEPERRYSSAAELASDLQRWLEHRPVEARPATLGYVLARFARRYRAAAFAALLAAAALAAASVVSLRYAWSEAQARHLADQRAAEAGAVNAFLERMLSAADPGQAQGRDVTVAEVIDHAEEALSETAMPAAAQLAAQRTLAATRLSLGDYERALALLDAALGRAVDGGDPPMRHSLLRMRGTTLVELGRFDEALAVLADADKAWPEAPDGDRMRVELARARVHVEAGRLDESIAAHHGLIAAGERGQLPEDSPILESARGNLVGILRDSGRLDEALALADQMVALRLARDGERHPRTLQSRHVRMTVLLEMDSRLDEAVGEGEAVLSLRRQVLGDGHASTLTTAQMLANGYLRQERWARAEPLIRETAAAFEQRLGSGHAQAITSRNLLAYLLEVQDRPDEAEAIYRGILAAHRDEEHRIPAVLAAQNNLGMMLMGQDRLDEAEVELRAGLRHAEAELGTDHPYAAIFAGNLGGCLNRMRRDEDAVAVLRLAHQRLLAVMGPDHRRTRDVADDLRQASARLGVEPDLPRPADAAGG